ncbi:hypothetical protein MTR_2g042460 [Medicago truncatula]|uniref:Uncharacterized protein n=1 Tax=Medicago truncatula TaxID=3880 RepID=G7IGG8_MEDTR|nr:hypothetical protein MTR_2g042460 [Medicago truncatula]
MKGAKIAIFLIGDQNCNILKHRGRKVQFKRESSREGAKGLEGRKFEEPRGDRDSRS